MSETERIEAFTPGSTIGHYSIVSDVGKGGMGEVYLAHDTRLGRNVALKVLPARFTSDGQRLKRFEVEARALAALNHPNIVAVHAIEEALGHRFLVMEFVQGRSLRALIPPGGMPLDQFYNVATCLADALAAAHASGVMHRDLKPENVMVTDSGRTKVLDFGLAKFQSAGVSGHASATHIVDGLTSQGLLVGTVPYMSPEQAEGDAIDPRSDIFSLGVLFHEMLTGQQPFRGRTATQVLASILRDDPGLVSNKRADVPVELAQAIHRCLSKRPEERFAAAADLHLALRALAQPDSRRPGPRVAVPIDDTEPSPVIWTFLNSRWGLTITLAGLGMFNWAETRAEESWSVRSGNWVGYDFAHAFSWFERGLTFDRHDLAGPLAVYLGSVAYFIAPVALLAMTLVALLRRKSVEGYRLFVFAITICYLIGLPFYLLTPVPERWAYPDSGAILLSDLWSARLIETIRPISGIDNCFPSFHTSGTVALVLVWYALRLRYRHAVAFLGAAVVMSTFLLGIHWTPDIVAGLAVAVVAVSLAWRLNDATKSRLATFV